MTFPPRNSRSLESRASPLCPIRRRFCSVMVKLARLHYYDFCATLKENKSRYKSMFVSETYFLSQMFFSASSKRHSELGSPVSSAGRTMRSLYARGENASGPGRAALPAWKRPGSASPGGDPADCCGFGGLLARGGGLQGGGLGALRSAPLSRSLELAGWPPANCLHLRFVPGPWDLVRHVTCS